MRSAGYKFYTCSTKDFIAPHHTHSLPSISAPLPAETTERYKLLAARYFSELVPRQLKEGAPPQPQRQSRRRGGWNGRRRQRL